jgi:hypothetical protein
MRLPYQLIGPGQRRGNRFWIVRGRRPDGREFEISTRSPDAADARRIAAIAYARIIAEGPAPARPVEPTFQDAADAYIRWRKPGRIDLARINRLTRRLGTLPAAAVTQDDLVRAANQHDKPVSGATLNREYTRPFAAILHYARDAGMRGDIRVRAFPERAPVVRVADRASVDLLIANAKTDAQRLLLLWLWDLGTRITDTVSVVWDDVDLEAAVVRLRVGKAGGAVRPLPLPTALLAALANVPEKRGRVFPWTTKSGVYKWLGPLCTKLGIRFRPHDARRALATEHFDAGADARVVQELMAHGSLKSTMRYRHVGMKQLTAAQRKRG